MEARLVRRERERSEVDWQVDVARRRVDLVGEPLLLVDWLLELGLPIAAAHALGAPEDLLAPPQQLHALTPRTLHRLGVPRLRGRLTLRDDRREAGRQVGAVERVKEAAIDAQALRWVAVGM